MKIGETRQGLMIFEKGFECFFYSGLCRVFSGDEKRIE